MRSRYGRTAAVVMALAASMTMRPQAQTPAPGGAAPFDIIGFIDAATVTPEADGFSGGGTVTVNGTTIIVPRNTLLQMPAFALTWQELFSMAPPPYAPNQSGLAAADDPAPATTYEIHVLGNRVVGSGGDEKYIAGLIFLSQQSLNAGAGFINYIDYATGELRVGGRLGDASSGARVFINDQDGKFGRPRAGDPRFDARFTIDEDNPTVRSETAFPMCVPRVDPAEGADALCPQSNRPKNGADFASSFTMDIAAGWAFMQQPGYTPNGSNPLMMAPFEIGDYVTYSGNLARDTDGSSYISAFSVMANVGIFTQPGTQPTYVAIDVGLIGVGGAPIPGLPQEATVRTRIEGFTTDPSSFVMLAAIDVDPCTGQESERWYDMVGVDPGAPTGAVAGRWRWKPNADQFTLPPTRMLRATSINGAYMNWDTGDMKTPAGLPAGIYNSPIGEYIFAENLGIGNPPVPMNFQEFPFLANGSGAYYGATGGEASLGILGQLSPWPGAAAPAGPRCAALEDGTYATVFTPVADAGPSQSVKRGDVVTLDASGSRDTTMPSPMPLTYTWWQVGADLKPLTANDRAHRIALPAGTTPFGTAQDLPRMTFPVSKFVNGLNIPDDTVLTFRVDVTNCSPWSDPLACATSSATMTVRVSPRPKPVDVLTGVSATWRASRSRLDVTASTTDPAAVIEVAGFGIMGPALPTAPGVPPAPGDRSYTQVGVSPPPTDITVRSNLGATVTVPVTVRP